MFIQAQSFGAERLGGGDEVSIPVLKSGLLFLRLVHEGTAGSIENAHGGTSLGIRKSVKAAAISAIGDEIPALGMAIALLGFRVMVQVRVKDASAGIAGH